MARLFSQILPFVSLATVVCIVPLGCSDPAGDRPAADLKASVAASGSAESDAVVRDIFTDHFTLDKSTQQYLWDIEHLAFVLNHDILTRFKDVLQGGRSDDLLRWLAPKFEGRVFGGAGKVTSQGAVTVVVWNDDHASRETLDRKALVDELVSHGKYFQEIEKVTIHVTSLSPEKYGDLKGRWTSQWDVHIAGRSADGGRAEHMIEWNIRFAEFSEESASRAGWLDSLTVSRAWRVHSPSALMEEITSSTGIDVGMLHDNWKLPGPPYRTVTGGAHLLDFDRDGRQDLLITGEKRPLLYHALGDGRFQEVSRRLGLANLPIHSCRAALVADIDTDGYEDLILTEERIQPWMHFTNAVYKNDNGRKFRLLGAGQHNLDKLLQYSLDYWGVADYDLDGKIDLYLAKAGRKPPANNKARWLADQTSNEGMLLRNLGNWHFEDVTEAAGMTGEYVDTFGVVWLDMEPDGDPDLFLANHMGENILWMNQGNGTFKKRPLLNEFGGLSMGAAAGDLDADGDPDLYLANMYSSAGSRVMANLRAEDYPEGAFALIQGFVTGNELYENRGPQGLKPLGISAGVSNAGWAYGPAVVDLDGDGALDLYAPAGFQSVERGKPDL